MTTSPALTPSLAVGKPVSALGTLADVARSGRPVSGTLVRSSLHRLKLEPPNNRSRNVRWHLVKRSSEQIDDQTHRSLCSSATVVPVIHFDNVHANQVTFCT